MVTSSTSATQRFFQKKRQEMQPQNPLPRYPSNAPWWQDSELTQSNRDRTTQPMEVVNDNVKHDYSRADHLRSSSGNCPSCGSASFVKPSASVAARCFDCGYIDGRQVNDLSTLDISAPSSSVPTLRVKQTADGGAQKYRGRFSRSGDELRIASAELEQSYAGKAYIDS